MIRQATVSDVQSLRNLCEQLGYDESKADIAERLRFIKNNDDHEILVYENQQGFVAGWAHVFGKHLLEGVYAELGGIVVDDSFRGLGIGGQLLTACEKWAIKKGYNELRVRSGGSRESAHRFYLQKGYANTKWQKVFNKGFDH